MRRIRSAAGNPRIVIVVAGMTSWPAEIC